MSASIAHRTLRRLPIVAAPAVILISISFLAGTPRSSAATTTMSVVASDDSYVNSATPTGNFGTATQLKEDAASDSQMVSYLKFNLSGLPGAPTSATLNLMSRSTGVTKT